MDDTTKAVEGEGQAQRKGIQSLQTLLTDYMVMLNERMAGHIHCQPSGFTDLDDKFGGWLHDGHLIIIAARPAMGKSAFVQQLVENVAKGNGKTGLFFSLEMSAYELVERYVSRVSGVPVPILKTGKLDKAQVAKVAEVIPYADIPVYIDDNSYSIDNIVGKAKAVQKRCVDAGHPPLGVIAVDYLQMVTTGNGGNGANRALEVGAVSMALKRLAKDIQVPVIAVAQLNRGVEGRPDKRPSMSDLRESGQIEQDADSIFMLYRDEYYHPDKEEAKGVAEVSCQKNRHGSTGTVRLSFVGERVMFASYAPQNITHITTATPTRHGAYKPSHHPEEDYEDVPF